MNAWEMKFLFWCGLSVLSVVCFMLWLLSS